MAVDFDLIVVGGARVGRYAAMRATQLGARVALIEPPDLQVHGALLWQSLLSQFNEACKQQAWLRQWSDQNNQNNPIEAANDLQQINWQQTRDWAKTLAETLELSNTTDSLPHLATAGVEVIVAEGSFYRHPQVGFAIADRLLRARNYLLALTTQAAIPAIDGLVTVNWVTLDSWQQVWQTLPQQVLIIGRDPKGIALAQTLNRLGAKITLLTSYDSLLPWHDPDAARILQSQLEAEGVTVLTQTLITQVRQIDQQVWVQAGDRAIETEAILLATKPQLALAHLNLEAVGVKCHPNQIVVNRKLQTTNPRIYACGEGLGSYASTAIDQHEADVALHNALFLPTRQVDYRATPWVLFTDPQFVQLGLSELQAKQAYGEDVLVAYQPLKLLEKAQISGNLTGFFKLIARRNGEILGAQCFAPNATEWMTIIAFAMQNRLKFDALTQLPALSTSFTALIQQAATQLQQQRRTEWQRELLETWFNFCRTK